MNKNDEDDDDEVEEMTESVTQLQEISNDCGLNMAIQENSEPKISPDINIEYINIKEEYTVDDDDNYNASMKTIDDEKEVDESCLEMHVNAWPVAIHFDTIGERNGSIISISDSDSYKDSTEKENSCSSSSIEENDNSSDISINVSDSRKRKKVLKMRKCKRQFNEQFKCNECSVRCNTRIEMSMHLYMVHKIDNQFYLNNRFMCRVCKQKFVNKSFLEAHINQMHTEKRIINCIQCNKVFNYRSYLTDKSFCSNSTSSNNSDAPRYKRFKCFHCNLKRT